MAFERITIVQGKTKAPAGVTITQNGKAVVALRKDIVTKAGFKAGASYSVLLGSDDDRGKLRIVLDKAGVPCARELKRTGAFFFNLGPVPAIGTTPTHQRPTEARLIDDGIEIDIPEDDGPKLLAPPKKEVSTPAAPPRNTKASKAAGETFNGVTINLTEDEETVGFNGRSIEVTTRQAKFVRLLARPRPKPIDESFLIGALWDGKPPAQAKEQLRQMAADLQKGLSALKLNLNLVKGAGYQLKDA